MIALTGGAAAGGAMTLLGVASGTPEAVLVAGIVNGTIGGATYGGVKSTLTGNDAKTVINDIVVYGVTGGWMGGFSASLGLALSEGTGAGGAIVGEIAENIDDVANKTPKIQKPEQIHHYATNKNQTYTPQFQEIASKYHLNLDDDWNKVLLPHQGRHPNAYHDYVLETMKKYDAIADGDQEIFLSLYKGLKDNIIENPEMLYKDYWIERNGK